mmetsp:Transcript_25699/g.60987  ORF Transcript_25699/g.60987 Transcript_25699/m.60987 type:complete len:224 (-) Transcript_25699:908-1579(-)
MWWKCLSLGALSMERCRLTFGICDVFRPGDFDRLGSPRSACLYVLPRRSDEPPPPPRFCAPGENEPPPGCDTFLMKLETFRPLPVLSALNHVPDPIDPAIICRRCPRFAIGVFPPRGDWSHLSVRWRTAGVPGGGLLLLGLSVGLISSHASSRHALLNSSFPSSKWRLPYSSALKKFRPSHQVMNSSHSIVPEESSSILRKSMSTSASGNWKPICASTADSSS